MEYKGYTIAQASNGHITICKDGQRVAHVSCSKKQSEEELRKTADFILDMREQASIAYICK